MQDTLQYYLHDESDAFRIELAGSLSGEGAQSVLQAWRTALSILGERPLTADITYLTAADERGSALLRLWHRHGVRIIATSPAARALAEPILGEPIPVPPAPQSWFRRLISRLTAAGIPSTADAWQSSRHAGRMGSANSQSLTCADRLESSVHSDSVKSDSQSRIKGETQCLSRG